MTDIRVYKAMKEIDESLGKKGLRSKRYDPLIEIYMGMVEQQVDVELKLQDETISEDSRKILNEIHSNLITDIETYKARLII